MNILTEKPKGNRSIIKFDIVPEGQAFYGRLGDPLRTLYLFVKTKIGPRQFLPICLNYALVEPLKESWTSDFSISNTTIWDYEPVDLEIKVLGTTPLYTAAS